MLCRMPGLDAVENTWARTMQWNTPGPEHMPERLPKIMSEYMPDRMPEKMPDIEGQKEYHARIDTR